MTLRSAYESRIIATRDYRLAHGMTETPSEEALDAMVPGSAETIKRWVVGLDLEAVPGRVGSDARAMHQAGLMQAACIARWFAIQRRERG